MKAVSATRQYNSIGTNAVKNDTRSFSAMALEQPSYNDETSPDYSHLYNTAYHPNAVEPNYPALGPTSKLNLFTAINSAMKTAMQTDHTAIMFGEDVAFGGVFRCSQNLREEFGEERVFNTPLSENGIAVSMYSRYYGSLDGMVSLSTLLFVSV